MASTENLKWNNYVHVYNSLQTPEPFDAASFTHSQQTMKGWLPKAAEKGFETLILTTDGILDRQTHLLVSF